MNLTIDIGNTLAKMAVLEDGLVVERFRFECLSQQELAAVFEAYPAIDAVIISSARDAEHLKTYLRTKVRTLLDFRSGVPVPLKNLYKTPETLGSDRLASAVGAATVYPGQNVLVVDFGTAITIDVVSAGGEYLGGNISPGASMRFRALNEFTASLPLRELTEETQLLGTSTATAIESGVIDGIVYEIDGYISRLEQQMGEIKIIFTGGDGNFFAKRLKNTIFATYDLLAYGLNRILEYNAD